MSVESVEAVRSIRSVRTTGLVLYRVLLLAFFAMTTGKLFLPGYPISWWWACLPLAAAFVLVSAMKRIIARSPLWEEIARRIPVEVEPPVRGRWSARNSPATKVPSHGTHAAGQTFAIDISAEPADGAGTRPGFALLWPPFRRSSAYPAYDEPLFAVADATVVHASDWRRSHLSRTSLPMALYMMFVEGPVRAALGIGWVTGNHIVLDLGDGIYAMYAHLRRGSLTVGPGDRIRAGQEIARCGNSGNSSEPHLHFQLMDGPDLNSAHGIPFRWRETGLPANGETFTVERAERAERAERTEQTEQAEPARLGSDHASGQAAHPYI